MLHEQEIAPLQFPQHPVDVWVDDINLDELVGLGEDGFSEDMDMEEENDHIGQDGQENVPMMQDVLNNQEMLHQNVNLNEQDDQQVYHQQNGQEVLQQNLNLNEQNDQQVFHQNLNVGMVLHNHFEADPALIDWERGKMAGATRLWAMFFSRGNADRLHTKISST